MFLKRLTNGYTSLPDEEKKTGEVLKNGQAEFRSGFCNQMHSRQGGEMLIHSGFIWNGEHLFGKQSAYKSRHLPS